MGAWVVPGFSEERELGSGASGRVVAAVRDADGQRVAIKYLSPRLSGDPQFVAAFRAEADLLTTLDVPYVVRLLEYAEAPGIPVVDRGSSPGGMPGAAIVMELVEGASLHEMITRQGPGSCESALVVLKGSLLGLAAAHELGIVHRDYKPENVLVDASGQSKLTDFGVAVRAGQGAAGGGTPLYMAPEQWDGGPATPATDIYAATVVFFECLTGMTPFSGALGQLAVQHAAAAVPVEQVDEPVRELIARGMAKDPAARPGSAPQFLDELEATAAAAYGADWEDRGRSHLAERAAALLLLLLPHGGAAAGEGTGSTIASSSLPGTGTANRSTTRAAAKNAARTGRAGRRGWLYTGIAAAVIGLVAGSIAAVAVSRSHSGSGSASHPSPSPARLTLAQQGLTTLRTMKQVPPLQTAGTACLAGIFKNAKVAAVSAALNNVDATGGQAVAWDGYTLTGDEATIQKGLAGGQVVAGTYSLGQVIGALLAATGSQAASGTPEQFQWTLYGLIGPAAISCAEAAFWLDGTTGGQVGTALQQQFPTWTVGPQLLAGRSSAIAGTWVLYRKLENCSITGSNGCQLDAADVTISCTGTACTIIRTNASPGFTLWDHPIPIAFSQGAWQASGTEQSAADCQSAPVPGTGVAFALKVTSGQVLNGVWRAQGLEGTYSINNVTTACFPAGTSVEDVSTTPFQ